MRASSSGWPKSSSSPVNTPYWGSSPAVNLQMRTPASLSGASVAPRTSYPRFVELRVLDEPTWTARAAAHAARVDTFVAPHVERRRTRVKHPVHDFLFTYYSQRPAQLRRWHPGYGVGLAGPAASTYTGLKGYAVSTSSTVPSDVATLSWDYVASRRPLLTALHE